MASASVYPLSPPPAVSSPAAAAAGSAFSTQSLCWEEVLSGRACVHGGEGASSSAVSGSPLYVRCFRFFTPSSGKLDNKDMSMQWRVQTGKEQADLTGEAAAAASSSLCSRCFADTGTEANTWNLQFSNAANRGLQTDKKAARQHHGWEQTFTQTTGTHAHQPAAAAAPAPAAFTCSIHALDVRKGGAVYLAPGPAFVGHAPELRLSCNRSYRFTCTRPFSLVLRRGDKTEVKLRTQPPACLMPATGAHIPTLSPAHSAAERQDVLMAIAPFCAQLRQSADAAEQAQGQQAAAAAAADGFSSFDDRRSDLGAELSAPPSDSQQMQLDSLLQSPLAAPVYAAASSPAALPSALPSPITRLPSFGFATSSPDPSVLLRWHELQSEYRAVQQRQMDWLRRMDQFLMELQSNLHMDGGQHDR